MPGLSARLDNWVMHKPSYKKIKIKTCRICKSEYQPQNTLQKTCWNPKCAIEQGRADRVKLKDKEHKLRKREFRKNDKSTQRKAAQTAFNQFIRFRDRGDGCISCDKPSTWGGQWHASHFRTIGARPGLRFDEDNCHKSCSVCNNHLSGNLANYREALIKKIGPERLERLETFNKTKRYTAEDYQRIAKEYRKKLKALKASLWKSQKHKEFHPRPSPYLATSMGRGFLTSKFAQYRSIENVPRATTFKMFPMRVN